MKPSERNEIHDITWAVAWGLLIVFGIVGMFACAGMMGVFIEGLF